MVEPEQIPSFPDALGLARLRMVGRMREMLLDRGFPTFRRGDGAYIRILAHSPATLSEIASFIGISPQAAAKAADSLEQRGYVERRADPGDRLRVVLTLTGHGAAYAAAIDEVVDLLDEDLRERVAADDLAAARRVLDAIIAPE